MNREWNEDNLEHEIESLLRVDPAPDFAVRVRQRVAEQFESRRISSVWRFCIAGSVAAVVLLFLAFRHPQEPTLSIPHTNVSAAILKPVPGGGAAPAGTGNKITTPARSAPFSRDEERVLRLLAQAVADGRVDLKTLEQPQDSEMELQPISEIQVEPLQPIQLLHIEPLNPDVREGANP